MAEYIDKERLLNAIECIDISDCTDIDDIFIEVERTVDDQPTADVAEVRHAHWAESEVTMNTKVVFCTNCFATYQLETNDTDLFDYCPRCGAKMDKEREQE